MELQKSANISKIMNTEKDETPKPANTEMNN
jgi:hypothetical protein